MNKKGSFGDTLADNAIYLVFALLFFSIMILFVMGQQNGADFWSDFYAKEISKAINLAKVGDEITLDVHKGSVIGKDNGVPSFSEMFMIDNAKQEVCVKLSRGRKNCYNYFNNVIVVDSELVLAGNDKGDKNVLRFRIAERSEVERTETNFYSNLVYLGEGEEYEFFFESESHTLNVLNVLTDRAELSIRSEEKIFDFSVGERRVVDLNGDGDLDISVELLSIDTRTKRVLVILTPLGTESSDIFYLDEESFKDLVDKSQGVVENKKGSGENEEAGTDSSKKNDFEIEDVIISRGGHEDADDFSFQEPDEGEVSYESNGESVVIILSIEGQDSEGRYQGRRGVGALVELKRGNLGVVTAGHVFMRDADTYIVTRDGQNHKIKGILGRIINFEGWQNFDYGLLETELDSSEYPSIKFGDPENYKYGDEVYMPTRDVGSDEFKVFEGKIVRRWKADIIDRNAVVVSGFETYSGLSGSPLFSKGGDLFLGVLIGSGGSTNGIPTHGIASSVYFSSDMIYYDGIGEFISEEVSKNVGEKDEYKWLGVYQFTNWWEEKNGIKFREAGEYLDDPSKQNEIK